LIEKTEPGACELCGDVAELRPYGPGGENICAECGARDPLGTQARMNRILESMLRGVTHVVGEDGRVGRVGHLDEDLSSRGDSEEGTS
jgi:hypothetical protein